jgi:hypothetical protein
LKEEIMNEIKKEVAQKEIMSTVEKEAFVANKVNERNNESKGTKHLPSDVTNQNNF